MKHEERKMKNLIKISLFLFFFVSSQTEIFAEKKAQISFEKTTHDFDKVYLGSGSVKYCFVFQNNGDEPLIIKDVRTSCGCVYGSWTKKPVAPSDTGSVCVIYKNNVSGAFNKTVRVISNAEKTSLMVKGKTVRK